jgi:predicted O-methyltransferase YrrM
MAPHSLIGRLRERYVRDESTRARLSAAPPAPAGVDFYGAAVVGASTIGERAVSLELVDLATAEVHELDPDAYTAHVLSFVEEGRRRAGASWRYADIVTVLAAAADLLRPRSYLEIGVRRGRSMSVVARRAPECALVGIDLWNVGYAGIENPGPEHVRARLAEVGHTGPVELLSGDSHEVLPRLWSERPDLTFDLVTVDGDHSTRGAARDLRDVLPRLRIGGALVFDDISHPAHPELAAVWRRVVGSQRRYGTWTFDDVGYGVAVAVRRW